MVTIGDVFSVIAAIAGICISAWALFITTTLLFTSRTHAAQAAIESRPWKAFGIGLAVLVPLGFLALAFMASPVPVVKLAGTILALGLLTVAAVGAGGLSLLVGSRMQPLDPSLSPYRAVAKGAAIVVAASLLPFVGWWVFMPVVLTVSLGAGVLSLFARQPQGARIVA